MSANLKFQIEGVVVLYNSEFETFSKNIPSYINHLNRLYIIGNSEDGLSSLEESGLRKSYNNIEFIQSESNLGIAKALNLAAKKAIENKADWLLTMDQDSYFPENDFSVLINSIPDFLSKWPNTAIISPRPLLKNSPVDFSAKFEEMNLVMTSGNLLKLESYKAVGPYLDKLFIDYVDHEYCLRLRLNGFKIVMNNETKLIHRLGDLSSNFLLWHEFTTSNHNKFRRYYIIRNRLFTMFKYFSFDRRFFFFELKSTFTEIFKILFFENDKLGKLAYTFLGMLHFLIGKYGSLPESE